MAAKSTPTPIIEESKRTRTVFIRAEGVQCYGNGLFSFQVPSRELKQDEYKLIDRMFPHTMGKVEELLSTESLISAQDMPLVNFSDKPIIDIDRNGNTPRSY